MNLLTFVVVYAGLSLTCLVGVILWLVNGRI